MLIARAEKKDEPQANKQVEQAVAMEEKKGMDGYGWGLVLTEIAWRLINLLAFNCNLPSPSIYIMSNWR